MRSTRSRYFHLFSAAIYALAALAPFARAPLARADDELSALLDSPIVRIALLETTEGQALLGRLGVSDLPSLDQHLASPELAETRAELRDRLGRLKSAVDAAPAERAGEALRVAAAGELRVNDEFLPGDDVFKPEAPRGYEATREKFLSGKPDSEIAGDDPADEPVSSEKTPKTAEEKADAVSRIRAKLGEMRACVQKRGPEEATSARWRYMLTQWGIDESMLTAGAVTASGFKQMEWKNLPSDIFFDSMSSLVGTRLISAQAPLLVRWFRLGGFGLAQSAVDAVVYFVSPVKDEHGRTDTQATERRFEYNVGWNLAYSPVQLGIYELVSGLSCLYPESKSLAAGLTAFRLGTSYGSNIAYFRLRRHFQ
jgi:hypothetical protein